MQEPIDADGAAFALGHEQGGQEALGVSGGCDDSPARERVGETRAPGEVVASDLGDEDHRLGNGGLDQVVCRWPR